MLLVLAGKSGDHRGNHSPDCPCLAYPWRGQGLRTCRRTMPIGEFEREILRLIARNRNPDSFIAGTTVLHQSATSPRASRDVDVSHDTKESLAWSVEADTAVCRHSLSPPPLSSFRRAGVGSIGQGWRAHATDDPRMYK